MSSSTGKTLLEIIRHIKYADSLLIIGLNSQSHELTISQFKRSDGTIFRCLYDGNETRLLFAHPDFCIDIFKGERSNYTPDRLKEVKVCNSIIEFIFHDEHSYPTL